MDNFNFTPTKLSNVYVIASKMFREDRGFWKHTFCAEDFREIGLKKSITQVYYSKTLQNGIVRGLYYQIPPFLETKIIGCLKGELYGVVVDIRRYSPTFLQYVGINLSEGSGECLYIPEGFAYGFQSLSDEVEMLYLATAPFNTQAHRAINPLDSKINVRWVGKNYSVCREDKNTPFLENHFLGIEC